VKNDERPTPVVPKAKTTTTTTRVVAAGRPSKKKTKKVDVDKRWQVSSIGERELGS